MQGLADIRSMSLAELEKFVFLLSLPKFRAKQIFQWVQQKGVSDFALMTNLSELDRNLLSQHASFYAPEVITVQKSAKLDTVKLLLQLSDGSRIETALMLYSRKNSRDRATVCVSTQTGCAMGCKFCATGLCKEPRNLTAGEIISQVLLAKEQAQKLGFNSITNVVYMGMGEPLLNLDAVKRSILLLNDSAGLGIGMRKFAVSTCGLAEQIFKMADWQLQIELAISLHAPNDSLRQKMMPIAKKYQISDILNACRYYQKQTGQRFTCEYALFQDVNDDMLLAHQLGELLRGQDCLVNIIPANPVKETGFFPSRSEVISEFSKILLTYGLDVHIREARGIDIDAACGQLRRRG